MAIVHLTQKFIDSKLQCPPGKKRAELCDKDLPGLYVEVRQLSPGQGTYYLRYKNPSGKTSHQKIGTTAEMTLSEARKKAKELKAEIALGADPIAERKARKAIPTFSEFMEQQYLPYAQAHKRSWKSDETYYRLRLKRVFGELKLDRISRHQIQTFHTSLREEEGLSAAYSNHHVKLMKHAINLAVSWEILEKNPATRIPLFFEDNKVENYMDEEELERLLNVLRTNRHRRVCLIAMYLLSTGARLNEALQATWDQVDRRNRLWRIPARNSKSKRVRSVPLNDSALYVLDQLGTEESYEYLFVNPRTKRPFVSIHKVWGELRNEAGLPHLRIHDLRHQYASFLVNAGHSLYTVQQALGHSDPKVTQRYSHLSTRSLREASDSASVLVNRDEPGSG